ncbi:MAG: DUF362 domain-containing protein [Nitrospirae bacterium]|nr:DUF362 domain-containing protein [Nitrospirota bacterium]
MLSATEEIIAACGWEEVVSRNARIVIKPNLCTEEKDKVEASNTSPELMDAVCSILSRKTKNITIGESDGARYSADDAAQNTGVFDIVKKYGIKWSNFSKGEFVDIGHPIFGKYKTLMPKELMEADAVIDMPVLKTHALTVFTGAIKNQWGCVPRYDRILMHKYLDELLSDLIGIVKPRINIMDGIVCVEGRGPSNGIPRRMDIILGSTDPVALDATAMRLIGLDPFASKHIVLSAQKGFGNIEESNIEKDGPFKEHTVEFIPAPLDFAVASMNYMTRYRFFVKYILFNQDIFKHTRKLVIFLRKVGVLKDLPNVTS